MVVHGVAVQVGEHPAGRGVDAKTRDCLKCDPAAACRLVEVRRDDLADEAFVAPTQTARDHSSEIAPAIW